MRGKLSADFFAYCKDRMGNRNSYMTENKDDIVELDKE
jgi:hypothetical protein